MQGVSRDTFAGGQERLEALLTAGRAAGRVDAAALGEDLFGVTGLLTANPGLRRAFTDPSRDGGARAEFAARLLGGKVAGEVVELVAALVTGRWSRAGDLTDAVEGLAVTAVLAGAEAAGRLEDVEDELFRFSRTVAADQRLRDAFSSRTEGTDRKETLVRRLLADRVAPETLRLAVQAAVAPRGLRTEQALEYFVEAVASRRRQLVAHVVAALPLTEAQRARLGEILRRQYGRPIRLNIDIDPDVVGGIRVEVGGEVVDGTVSTRLDDARRRLAG
ncbi:MAG: F-type H+-transporting ATPase subunit delta [Actinomycetota bacterium]|nr:F-type H+-transporting ATPase subunit delta [Actinomycetota bacterium]